MSSIKTVLHTESTVTVGRDRLCLVPLHVVMPLIARGQASLFQPLPVSTVPNTGMNISNSNYRGLDGEYCVTNDLNTRTYHHMPLDNKSGRFRKK